MNMYYVYVCVYVNIYVYVWKHLFSHHKVNVYAWTHTAHMETKTPCTLKHQY